MTARLLAAGCCGFALLAGCATGRGPSLGSELVGSMLRMQAASGHVTILRFRDNASERHFAAAR